MYFRSANIDRKVSSGSIRMSVKNVAAKNRLPNNAHMCVHVCFKNHFFYFIMSFYFNILQKTGPFAKRLPRQRGVYEKKFGEVGQSGYCSSA